MFNMTEWSIVLVILIFAVGLALIVKGGDFFVDAAGWIADVSGIPRLIIGATVVSLATTLPELLVSVFAAAQGSVDMAAGNAIGSVTANVALIMSLSILFMPNAIGKKDYYIKAILMILPAVLMFAFCFRGNTAGTLSVSASVLLIAIFIANIVENVYSAKKHIAADKLAASGEKVGESKARRAACGKDIAINAAKFLFGAAGIVIGAQFLVDSASVLASRMGVSEQIVGLTVVAIGTSLPELVTTITAIIKKQSSLSVGNIIGANIIDLTLILPVCGIIYGAKYGAALPISAQTVCLDIPVCLAVSLTALLPALIKGKFERWQGAIMLAVYIAYIALLIVGVDVIGLA